MTQADPWDEAARLEKQMEAELLAKLEGSRLRLPNPGARTEKALSDIAKPRAPEA